MSCRCTNWGFRIGKGHPRVSAFFMRVAALYDIHGNLPALEAVLEQVGKMGVEQIVIGGDVLPGPMPRETIDCLLNLGVPVQFIRGNGESAVLAEMAGQDPAVPPQFREVIRWCAHQLTPSLRELLASWPLTLTNQIDGLGEVLFCHATPRNENEVFTRLSSENRLLPLFERLAVDVVVCGHTHMQFDRLIGTTRIVNAGSVGMPFGEPGASWLLLGPRIQPQHTRYDLDAAAERIAATAYPRAADFIAANVLQPPPEKEMLELFARTELGNS
jgi:putative phosphoesterase